MKFEDNIQPPSGSSTHLSQLASVGQMAAGIAHEVKNPLTAVKGFLQLLQQEEENEYVDIAQAELDNALTTLNNLLQVSKPDLENEEFQTFNLSVELESILNLFQDKMYNITILTDFKDTNTVIRGKKNQFKRAFFNLIKNAIESIEGTGKVRITHEIRDNEIILTIADTGVGIPSDKLTLLGTPFFTTKDQGTGMGLAQVFSVIYQHGGKINVDSKVGEGTIFTIFIPQHKKISSEGMSGLELQYKDIETIKDLFLKNRKSFEDRLLLAAINVRDKIEEIHKVGNINLLNNAHRLVLLVVEEREHELITFAKQEGVAWAKFSLTLAFKLEWVQAIRRTLWDFLYNYDSLNEKDFDRESFFSMEKRVNELIDQFLNYFFISYTNYRDELLHNQRQLVENLSVPIIPINKDICILPLIGTVDYQRVLTIQDKVLSQIENQRIQTLILDLSGVTPMEKEIINSLIGIIDGIAMMGCKTVITGLRADIVKSIITSGVSISRNAEFKGTLQLALNDVLMNHAL
jgi:anti-anti-sigma regulatory factor/two-component sensor histidine kinase